MEKVVIIGSGPAGLTAALYTARANLAPVVVEGMQPGGQLTTTTDVENYPGFEEPVSGPDLVMRMKRQAERCGARCLGAEVIGVDLTARPFRLSLSDESVLNSVSVVVATGASAVYLGLESEQKLIGHGVSACATCDGAFYRGRSVAVVGGGDSAMEESMFLARLCSKVVLIHRRDELRASRIMAERVKANPKIQVVLSTVVTEVLGVFKGVVTGLRLRNVKDNKFSEIDVDGLFVAIGHKPNTSPFAGQLQLDDKGFIVAEHTRTSVEGVFAAGDVQDPRYKQAVTAAGSGCMAALEVERYLQTVKGQ